MSDSSYEYKFYIRKNDVLRGGNCKFYFGIRRYGARGSVVG
jgi:hypothetical protein